MRLSGAVGRGHPWTQRVQVAEVHTRGEEPLLTGGTAQTCRRGSALIT